MEIDLGRLVDALPALVWTATCDGAAEIVGQRWLEYTGLTASEVAGAGWQRAVHPDDIQRLLSDWIAILKSEEPGEVEARLRRFDGEYRWFLFRASPIRDPSGAIERWCGINVDIDDRKRALGGAHAHLGEAQRLSKTGSFTVDLVKDEHVWSEELYRMCGFEAGSKITLQRIRDVVHPEDRAVLSAAVQRALAGAEQVDVSLRLVTTAGLKHVHFVAKHAAESGDRAIFVGATQDVTETTLAKEALAANERLLRQTIDTIPVCVGSISVDGLVEFTNRPFREYTGLSSEQVQSRGWRTVIHPDDIPRMEETWRVMSSTGAGTELEVRIRRFDGEYRWFSVRNVPLRDDRGKIVRWYTVDVDIDDRRRADADLRRALAHLTEAQRLSKTGSFTTDLTGEHIWSDELYRICDLEIGTDGATFMDLVHPEDLQAVQAGIGDALSGAIPSLTFRIVTSKGVLKHLRSVGTVVDQVDRRLVIAGAIQDITESKLAEEALKANDAKLRRALTHLTEAQRLSRTGSFTADLLRDEHDWSEELYRIFDFDSGSKITAQRIRERIVPEDLFAYEAAIRPRPEEKYSDFELRIAAADGAVKHLRAVAHRNEQITDRPVFVGAIQDVTETRVAEEAANKARAELAHVTRVMTLNALTASIAHEVNQPLAGIITNASTGLRMLAADPPNIEGARTTAQRIIRDANRASEVIARLRALFARKQPSREPVDLNDAAREVLALLSSELQRSRVAVRTELVDGLPAFRGDRVQLQQVILNLVLNAADAMSGVENRARELLVTTARGSIDKVLLSVRDSGVGIDPQNARKLFEAFYTTKVNGMGIGLSISRSIVEGHNGQLWAVANEGPGATFSLSLPAIAEMDAAGKHDDTPSAEQGMRKA